MQSMKFKDKKLNREKFSESKHKHTRGDIVMHIIINFSIRWIPWRRIRNKQNDIITFSFTLQTNCVLHKGDAKIAYRLAIIFNKNLKIVP